MPAGVALAQARIQRKRLDWDTFKLTSAYPDFVRAIKLMRENNDPNDRRSWTYWINAHLNYCPHGTEYFLAWHRGYLYYFEESLRMVSGNPSLTLPYWNYYKSPVIPAEFTNSARGNPLYSERSNTNVSAALTLAPFSKLITNFERGTTNSFEASLEGRPHDPVHDIIGSIMATMHSPDDAIFWPHHANIDRLWSAWVVTKGNQMPANNSAYWAGQFTYGPGLVINRNQTISTRSNLDYFYDDESFPQDRTTIVQPTWPATVTFPVSGQPVFATIVRPPLGDFALSAERPTDSGVVSLSGARYIGLNDQSVSASLPIDPTQLRTIVGLTAASSMVGSIVAKVAKPASIQLVLDDVHLTDVGQKGGYFYQIYLNLPSKVDRALAESKYLVGSIGPFAIAGALHHAQQHMDHARGSKGAQSGSARLAFPLTGVLEGLSLNALREMVVSFVKVNGDNVRMGEMITVGEIRIEVSTD